ncbi:MAG: ketoacyl-ACP synthase III [Pseudomonadales bacterium]|nr:ketoacyl-ACP synthase III [Pseudomonadales bacterium]
MNMTGFSRIVAIGSYLPDIEVASEDLMDEIQSEKRFGVPNTWLTQLTGIRSRRFAIETAKPSDLAIEAGRKALEKSEIEPTDVGMVIYCGIDRDWVEPATSHRVQRELGCKNAACLDVTNACHGFTNGMSVGDAMIATGAAENVLVVTGEVPSQVAKDCIADINKNPTEENFRGKVGGLTTGDAGGAVILQRASDDSGVKAYRFASEGRFAELCYYKFDEQGKRTGQMLMEKISAAGLYMHKSLISGTYKALNWKPEDVDYLICHQAGRKPHERCAEIAEVDIAKAPVTYEDYGNLTSASIPVTLDLAGSKEGDRILILGTGSGLSISQIGLVL